MEINNAISSLSEDFQVNNQLEFNYYYDIICEIFVISQDNIHFILQVKNYSCKKNPNKIIVQKTFENIEVALKYIHNIFTCEGNLRYSRIVDEIFETEEEMKNGEKIMLAKNTLMNRINECCVCSESNSILTSCGHNLCRYCFSKMYKLEKCCEEHNCDKEILCPLCKQHIY
jgi:hypothetical protein